MLGQRYNELIANTEDQCPTLLRLKRFNKLFQKPAVLLTIFFCVQSSIASDDYGKQIENPRAQITKLEQSFEELTTRIEQKVKAIESKVSVVAMTRAQREGKARKLLSEIDCLSNMGNVNEARTKIAEFRQNYAETDIAWEAAQYLAELETIGKDAPKNYDIEKWFQGKDLIDLAGDKTTLLIFWEIWCSHYRTEVPRLQQLYQDFHDTGLQIVAVTKASEGTTNEEIRDFLAEQEVSYPAAKETGVISEFFNINGIPAAVVVKDSKVIWRGHPARINDDVIKSWLVQPLQKNETNSPT